MALGAIIGGAALIGSSLLSKSSSSSTNTSNLASVNATNDANLRIARETNDRIAADAARDRQLQEDFAQMGIRWKVSDAQQAGIHPLYALGGSGAAYTPSAIRYASPTMQPFQKKAHDYGALGRGGQDLARAIESTRTPDERLYARRHADLSLRNSELQNDLLASQIARLNADQIGPPLPGASPTSTGEPFDRSYTVEPARNTAVLHDLPSYSAGMHPESDFVHTPTGAAPVPHRKAYEDPDLGNPTSWGWYYRNYVKPFFGVQGSGNVPPNRYLPEGGKDQRWHGWMWDRFAAQWKPHRGPVSWHQRPFYRRRR